MSKRLTKDEFVKRAKKVHGGRYDYSKVEYRGYNTKVCIICPKHGEFWQKVGHHLSGHGCPKCVGRNGTIEEFIQKARKIHGKKYDYSCVDYKNTETKVKIICPKHGEFWQTPHGHLSGRGCQKCRGEFLRKKFVSSKEEFLERARKVHGDRYDYDGVNYVNNRIKIKIVCPKHGEFWQRPDAHLSGQGCPECSKKRTKESIIKGVETRRRLGTLNSSALQKDLEKRLINRFGKDDVFSEYRDEDRYPFCCDFYVKSLDLFIELNAFWTHGSHWFDKDDEDDIYLCLNWSQKNSAFYKNAIETWTQRDVKKREFARKSDLNYVVFWGACEEQIDQWFKDGCPIRQDWK